MTIPWQIQWQRASALEIWKYYPLDYPSTDILRTEDSGLIKTLKEAIENSDEVKEDLTVDEINEPRYFVKVLGEDNILLGSGEILENYTLFSKTEEPYHCYDNSNSPIWETLERLGLEK